MKAISRMRLSVWVLGCLASALVQAQSVAGRTVGEARVSASGAARYVAPLSLPAGTNGRAPTLSLSYSNRDGNGLLGVGFQLEGLSTIERCPRTIAQDGAVGTVSLDGADRFCLDGQRLQLTSGVYGAAGSQYQTEVERFSRVTAAGAAGTGPASFVVETRAGLIYEYGATPDSRVEAAGSATPRAWAVNRIRDRDGNYVDFTYTEDSVNGSHRPAAITYTGNLQTGASPYYVLRFAYESRPAGEIATGYFAGGVRSETQRLDRIDLVHIATNTLVRRFEFSYSAQSTSGRSRLASLQVCGSSDCLAPTRFDWIQGATGWSTSDLGTLLDAAKAVATTTGDMNGDGREDLAYFDTVSARWFVLHGGPAGYAGPAQALVAGTATSANSAISLDLDGDGKRDLLVTSVSPTTGTTWQWLHHGSNGAYQYMPTGIPNQSIPESAAAADVDGDGRDDLLYAKLNNTVVYWRRNLTTGGVPSFAAEAKLWTSPYPTSSSQLPYSTSFQSFRTIVRRGDFNGDGRSDLLFQQQYNCPKSSSCTGSHIEWHVLVSGGTSLAARGVLDTAVAPQVGDFNGDGLTDVLYSLTSGGTAPWKLQLGTGAGSGAILAPAVATTLPVTLANATVQDWDGDLRSDVLFSSSAAGWQYCPSSGTALGACSAIGSMLAGVTGPPVPTDVNGDGATDIVYPATEWRYLLRQSGRLDRMSAVTDGLGATTQFAYGTLANGAAYTPGSGAAFPSRDAVLPLTVVTQFTTSDGTGSSYATTLSYEGARFHAQGRGFLGFAKRTVVDGRTRLATQTDSLQDPASFETIGLPSSVTLRQAGGQIVERRAYSWASKVFGAGTAIRRFPYPAGVVEDRYELDGTRVATSATTNVYDDFGSLIDRTTVVTEVARGLHPGAQHVRRLATTVMNDTAYWCLGRATSNLERRSHTLAGGVELAQTRTTTWDVAKCRPTQEIREPLSPTLQVVTDLTYDAYGNVASSALTPVGQPVRRTNFTWTESGRFLGTVAAPEAHVLTTTWSPVSAQPLRRRDPNGRETQWRYDSLDRLIQEILPDGTSRAFTRIACVPASNCAWPGAALAVREIGLAVGGATLRTTEVGFDMFERAVYSRQDLPGSAQALSVQRFNSFGQVSQSSLPELCCTTPTRWIAHSYDILGRQLTSERPTSQSDPTPAITRYRHDGLAVTLTDPAGRTTTRRFDVLGNPLQVTDPAGVATSYDYDAFGRLVKVRDATGSETAVTYDLYGQRLKLVDPDSGTWTSTYSAVGEILSQTNPQGQRTTFAYDLLGRRVTRSEPEGVTTWTWGHEPAAFNVGAVASVSSPGFQESYTYDSVGRPTVVARTVAGTVMTTGLAYETTTGQLSVLTYPGVSGVAPLRLRYVQDRGRVVQVVDADNPGTVYWRLASVNPAGRVTSFALGNGVQVTNAFDAVTGLPVSQSAVSGGGSALQSATLNWDLAGNLRDRTDSARGISEQFDYDNRDRLDLARRGGAPTLDLAYDEIGNITSKSDVGTYRYDTARKHAVVAAGSNSYAYDASGSMTNANGSAVSWFSYGLPSQITHPNGNYSAFYYGADRSRYRQVARGGTTLTDTLYALDGLYERYARSGVTYERQYIVADGKIVAVRNRAGTAAPTVTYLLNDHLGGADAFVSASGSLLARASYHPMGARRAGDGSGNVPTAAEWAQIAALTPRGYTGHEHLDNLGVIHMNGRVYDPTLGRFLSPDPIVQAPYDGQSLNRYSYALNNPHRYTDPSGYCFGSIGGSNVQLECLDIILVEGYRWSEAPSIWLTNPDESFGHILGRSAPLFPGGPAIARAPMESITVVGSRLAAPKLPNNEDSGNGLWADAGLAVLLVVAVVEPTPVGEGVVVVVMGSRAGALAKYYPTNNGFLLTAQKMWLEAGQVIDRFGGSSFSRFFAKKGAPAAARALPPGVESEALRTFEVLQSIEVEGGMVAPAWEQLGLGIQYRTPLTLGEMLEQGILREIHP